MINIHELQWLIFMSTMINIHELQWLIFMSTMIINSWLQLLIFPINIRNYKLLFIIITFLLQIFSWLQSLL